MSRRRQIAVLTAVTVAVAAASATGASATTKKKAPPKLKTIKGSYSVTLVPDPSPNAPGRDDCGVVNPKAVDVHALSLPGTGTLRVVLDSPDPTGQGLTDWDLVILDSHGTEYDASTGGTSQEETDDPGMKKGKVSIEVCNLAGGPTGTVNYTYTYR